MGSEQRLAVMWLALATLQTLRAMVRSTDTGTKGASLPAPRKYLAGLVLVGVLSVVAKFSPSAQRLADTMMAVVVLGFLVAWVATPQGQKTFTEVVHLPGEITSSTGLPKKPTRATAWEFSTASSNISIWSRIAGLL